MPAGQVVGSYRIVRLVGRGGMGEVYLARDVNLGRKVALKLIRPGAIGDERAVVNFLREARITAQFNHPHIVTLYGAGEWEGRPYVALEFLEGQTLRERMEEQRLGLREILRFALAIAEALAEAHRNQVLHRDLKPENVFLPRDGRLRVVDFGLAQGSAVHEGGYRGSDVDLDDTGDVAAALEGTSRASQDSGLIVGTPDYMAPEQWKGLVCAPATDLWALGLILYELLTGRLPHPTGSYLAPFTSVCGPEPVSPMEPFEPLPPELERLVYQCLEKDPDRRPTGEEAIRSLHDLVHPERGRSGSEDSPFRGLLPFFEEHTDVFYGRDGEIAAFIERLRQQPLLPVVGPSGAGKSSFIQAGVVPRLREQRRWIVLRMRPGRQPFDVLAARLVRGERSVSALNSTASLRRPSTRTDHAAVEKALSAQLAATPSLLGLKLQQLSEDEDAWVLLVLDQLEEVYTLVGDPETRRAFMTSVCSAADDPDSRVRVVMTLRDDFIVRLAETEQAREALGHVTVLRGPGPDALREILEKPVKLSGYRYEDPEMLDEMVAAVGYDPASLPLVQVAAAQLWDERDRSARILRRSAYEAMGGIEGALARQVDGVLAGLTPAQHQVARELFIRLVTPERTRKVLPRDQLVEGLGDTAEEVLSRLVAGRALVARRGRGDAADGDVELVHESLIRNWARLARWLDESREELAFLSEVGQAAELWEKRGRSAEEVWRGPALQQALARSSRIAVVPSRVRSFLDAGARLDRRRSRTRRVVAAGAFALLASVAAVLAWQGREANAQRNIAEQQRHLADQGRRLAEHNGAEALREGAAAALFREDMVEARAKLRLAIETTDSPSIRSLWAEIAATSLRGTATVPSRAWTAAFLPERGAVAALDVQGSIHVIDADSTGHRRVARWNVAQVAQAAFSDDGSKVVSTDERGEIRIWDVKHETLQRLPKAPPQANWFCISQDGGLVASAHGDGTVHVFAAATGEEKLLVHGDRRGASRAAFAPDGRLLASGEVAGAVRIWDVATGKQLHVLEGHDKLVAYVAFSPDGKRLVSSGWDGIIRVWDVESGQLQLSLLGHAGAVFRSRFSPDGSLLASASGDKTVRIWSAASGALVRTLRGHADQVYDLDFSADGRTLLSLDGLGVIRFWNLDAGAAPERLDSHEGSLFGVDVSPDGETIASAGRDGTIRLWSRRDGSVRAVLRGHESGVLGAEFNPDGTRIVSGGNDHTVRIWDTATDAAVHVMSGHKDSVVHPSFSSDGKRVASPSNDGTVRVWDAVAGEKLFELLGHTAGVNQAVFSPDGRTIATGGDDGTIRLWDATTRVSRNVIEAHPAAVYGPRYSLDGTQMVSGGWDGTVRVWDSAGKGRIVTRCSGYAFYAAFDPDASHVAASCADGLARIVDLAGGGAVDLVGHVGHVTDVQFSPDGKRAVTAGDDATVRLWDAATGRPAWYSVLLRTTPPEALTHRGWESMGGAPAHGGAMWRTALERDGRIADELATGGTLCVATWQSTVELWDTAADKLVWSKLGPGTVSLSAARSGCVVLGGDGELAYIDREGNQASLQEHATAFSLDGDTLLYAADGKVGELRLGESPDRGRMAPAAGPVSAVARVGDWLALGHADGDIDLVVSGVSTSRPLMNLAGFASAAVTRIVPGPGNTLVAAFSNGMAGVWDLGNGARIRTVRLHGKVFDLHVAGYRVLAVSELGDHAEIDLGILQRDYCDVVRAVWKDVPTVWQGGRAIEQAPSPAHPCFVPEQGSASAAGKESKCASDRLDGG